MNTQRSKQNCLYPSIFSSFLDHSVEESQSIHKWLEGWVRTAVSESACWYFEICIPKVEFQAIGRLSDNLQ